jgi:hypothetical protein
MAKVLGDALMSSNLTIAASNEANSNAIVTSNHAMAAVNEANSKFLVQSLQAIQLSAQEGRSVMVVKKKADPTLVLYAGAQRTSIAA